VSGEAQPVGTIEVALNHSARLLDRDPKLAAAQATEILKVAPRHPAATLMLGVALRRSGRTEAALGILEPLAQAQANWAAAQYEQALALLDAGQSEAAVASLRRTVALQPDMVDAWRALGDQLTDSGDAVGADAAYARQIKASTRDPRLMTAAAALCENQIPQAEALLRAHLKQFPTDVAAIRMFAEVAARLRRYDDAENLLTRCLELSPSFAAARHNYAVVLYRQNKPSEALREIETLLELEPHNPGYKNLKAAILARIGDFQQSIDLYDALLAAHPRQPKIWMSYGHALKTHGREADSIAAYDKSIELLPSLGEAYWSLANLKTVRFTTTQIDSMRAQLARPDLADEDRFHLHFALGKALEDSGAFAESFEHYARGNNIRRAGIRYSDIPALARSVTQAARQEGVGRYPEPLAGLDARACRALGEQYLAGTRIQRKSDAPFFIDKLPNNFLHIGLIQLALPNAKIIDARRHPLGCCFSGFKQHFARGQNFTYGLEDIGRYYHDYVELMSHFDKALPGRIHRVFYESMIEDTEAEVRRLLEYCGLPFEAGCLRFYENERAVRTASSQQVRQPIYRAGLEQWRHYEPWLQPLKTALGPVLDVYPRVPEFRNALT
jgi:predicted Zn-dependent protease